MKLSGLSFIGSSRGATGGAGFRAFDPAAEKELELVFHSASAAELERAVQLASAAAPTPGKMTCVAARI